MGLPRRQLGSTDMQITAVGLGAWALGGSGWAYSWGAQDDSQSIRTIRHALDLGINWIDTAAIYGLGHSEEVVGRAIKDMPAAQRPLLFTKCGRRLEEKAGRLGDPVSDLRPQAIRRECEQSLRRLGTEAIDLYQFHWPDQTGPPVEESWAEMVRLLEEGKVRAIGVCNFGTHLLDRCEAVRHVDSLQPPFSMINRDMASGLLPWCLEHNTGVIVYSPMQAGLLTGTFSAERVARLADDDWRKRAEHFVEPQLSRNVRLAAALKPVAERHSSTVAAVAVAWTLNWSGVTAAIVGGRSPEQVDGWIGAGELRLSDQDLDDLAGAMELSGAGSGPFRPASKL